MGRRVSVSGMLDFLGVSRSGYRAFLKHRPSDAEQRKERIVLVKKSRHEKCIFGKVFFRGRHVDHFL